MTKAFVFYEHFKGSDLGFTWGEAKIASLRSNVEHLCLICSN